MNILNMPGFTAAASLYDARQYDNSTGMDFRFPLPPERCGGPWGVPVLEEAFISCMQKCFFNNGHFGTTGNGCKIGCCRQLTGCSKCYIP